jgi:hypothetical protein
MFRKLALLLSSGEGGGKRRTPTLLGPLDIASPQAIFLTFYSSDNT